MIRYSEDFGENLFDSASNWSIDQAVLTFKDVLEHLQKQRNAVLNLQNQEVNFLKEPTQNQKLSYKVKMETSKLPKKMTSLNTRFDENEEANPPLKRQLSAVLSVGGQSVVKYNRRKSISRSLNGEIKINQYTIKELIGRGAFAEVKICEDTISGETFAVKILDKHHFKKKMFAKSEDKIDRAMRKEVAILKQLDHPNIVKLVEVIEDVEYKKLYLIMEYCEKGAINRNADSSNQLVIQVTPEPKKLGEEQLCRHMRSLVLALDYLHNQVGITHRDIKPENLLIDATGNLKLSDFGLSTEEEGQSEQGGTKVYMAPETFNSSKIFDSKANDIWALGITIMVLLTGGLPFPESTDFELAQTISKHKFDFISLPVSNQLKHFLSRCLEKEPAKRATVTQLLSHIWLTKGKGVLVNVKWEGHMDISENQWQQAIMRGKLNKGIED